MLNQAVIFCGGFGKRLMPITKKIPKPMVNVNGKPFLFHLIQQCKNNGIKKILLLCGYKSDVIRKYFNSGKKMGITIQYHINPPEIETYKRIYEQQNIKYSIISSFWNWTDFHVVSWVWLVPNV